jgi:subfamily B ATP-binding cassette protein MsbA
MENFELNKFKHATRRLAHVNLKWVRTQAISSPYMEVVGAVAFGVMLFYIQGRIPTGEMTLGKFGVFLTAFACLYDPVRRMSGIYNTFQQAKGASSKVFELIEERPEIVDKPDAWVLQRFEREIEFRRVSFNYSDSRMPVLKELDLTVSAGEVIAFVDQVDPERRRCDPAAAVLRSNRRADLDRRPRHDHTGVTGSDYIVTQETVLFNDTVRNNICYGRPT